MFNLKPLIAMFLWYAIIFVGITLNLISFIFGGNKNWGK